MAASGGMCPSRDPAHGAVGVDPPVAEELVEAGDRVEALAALDARDGDHRRVVRRQRRLDVVARVEVDVVGGGDQDLLDLLGRERERRRRAVVARIRLQRAAIDGVERRRHDQAGHPGAAPGRLRRAARRRHGDGDVPAVVRAPVEIQVRVRRLHDPADVVEARHRVHLDRVVVVGRIVVVVRLLVGRRGDHRDAALVGVVDRLLAEARLIERPQSLLHDPGAAVDGEDDPLGEVVHRRHEAVAGAHLEQHAVRAGAGAAAAVVRLGGRIVRLAGAVPVAHLVERVVVVFEEVPAADVVDVAVSVVVVSVREQEDEVLRIDDAVAVLVLHARVLLVPVVGQVVADVEDPVAVAVVGVSHRVAALGNRQLAAVEVELVHHVGKLVLPADAGVDHGDQHVGPPGGHLPGEVDAGALDAEELLGIGVDQRVAGLIAGQLPVVVAEVVGARGRLGRRQEEISGEVGRLDARRIGRRGAARRRVARVRHLRPGARRERQKRSEPGTGQKREAKRPRPGSRLVNVESRHAPPSLCPGPQH